MCDEWDASLTARAPPSLSPRVRVRVMVMVRLGGRTGVRPLGGAGSESSLSDRGCGQVGGPYGTSLTNRGTGC